MYEYRALPCIKISYQEHVHEYVDLTKSRNSLLIAGLSRFSRFVAMKDFHSHVAVLTPWLLHVN